MEFFPKIQNNLCFFPGSFAKDNSYTVNMEIREAKIYDAQKICDLISSHAQFERMIFRSLADIYESIQSFKVADIENRGVVGCGSLQVTWSDLAEIRSLAVDDAYRGKGIGRDLVLGCIEKAKKLGIKKVFTLTLEPAFFEKIGFKIVKKETLPMKVWSDCAKCPKQDNCDEIALIFEIP